MIYRNDIEAENERLKAEIEALKNEKLAHVCKAPEPTSLTEFVQFSQMSDEEVWSAYYAAALSDSARTSGYADTADSALKSHRKRFPK